MDAENPAAATDDLTELQKFIKQKQEELSMPQYPPRLISTIGTVQKQEDQQADNE